uniref:Uncharacterized protein n=1 Tax=Anguilla anguilla TaxID=7936 RepID=A0A0E9W6X9_ANGAN
MCLQSLPFLNTNGTSNASACSLGIKFVSVF